MPNVTAPARQMPIPISMELLALDPDVKKCSFSPSRVDEVILRIERDAGRHRPLRVRPSEKKGHFYIVEGQLEWAALKKMGREIAFYLLIPEDPNIIIVSRPDELHETLDAIFELQGRGTPPKVHLGRAYLSSKLKIKGNKSALEARVNDLFDFLKRSWGKSIKSSKAPEQIFVRLLGNVIYDFGRPRTFGDFLQLVKIAATKTPDAVPIAA